MKRLDSKTMIAALGLLVSTGAFAAGGMHAAPPQTSNHTITTHTVSGPTRTGQPNQSCGSASAPNTPGNAAVAPGSAFNPDGKSGTVYAGQQPQNSVNPLSVSQYDVACFHQH